MPAAIPARGGANGWIPTMTEGFFCRPTSSETSSKKVLIGRGAAWENCDAF